MTALEHHRCKVVVSKIVVGLCLLTAVFTTTKLVQADNGPHGGYLATTSTCAACHRSHTAPSASLLIDSPPNLCYSCHGTAGLGADTNVQDGVYLERDTNAESPAEGIASRGLKGGGFNFALMDTDGDGTYVSTAVTSSHNGNPATIWGNGAIASGVGATFSISCISCHNPHGGSNYRSLRAEPYGSGAAGPVTVTDEALKDYTIDSATGGYYGEFYDFRAQEMTAWCVQCHTRYHAPLGSGHTDSGDVIYAFRHPTENVPCVQCHVAHGTAATMAQAAGMSVQYPDGTTAVSDDARSSLLRQDDRRICYGCHVRADGSVNGLVCTVCHSQPQGPRRQIVGPGADFSLASHHVSTSITDNDCIVCHNQSTHTAGVVRILNADNGSTVIYDGTPDSLEPICLACHDADAAGGFPPFSDAVTPPIIDQPAWAVAAHNTNYSCADCHTNGHGSVKINILDPWNATPDASLPGDPLREEEGFCYVCHDADGPAATNIEAEFNQPTHHNVSAADLGGEFLECTNCHNPHLANTTNQLADPDNTAVAWTGTQEDFCITCHDGGTPPTGVTFPGTANGTGYDKTTFVGSRHDVMVNGTDSCRACHDQHGSPNRSTLLANYEIAARGPSRDDGISFIIRNDDSIAVTVDTVRVNWDLGGGNGVQEIRFNDVRLWQEPPWGLSGDVLDIAPDETMNSGELRTVEVRFDQVIDPNASGWVEFNTTSGQTCYVTFGSGVAPVPGNPCQLTAVGTPLVGVYTDYATDYAMCWQCHDANDVIFVDNVFGEHEKHVIREGASCIMCHDAHAPHDAGEAGLINFDFPIQNGYNISFIGGAAYDTSSEAFWFNGGRGYCYILCHGKDHTPKDY